jgi:hypothetical protein
MQIEIENKAAQLDFLGINNSNLLCSAQPVSLSLFSITTESPVCGPGDHVECDSLHPHPDSLILLSIKASAHDNLRITAGGRGDHKSELQIKDE